MDWVWYNRIRRECVQGGVFPESNLKSIIKVDNQDATDFVMFPIEIYMSKHIDVKLLY